MVCHLLSQIDTLRKSRSQDNPLNPLENNRIKKTKGSRAYVWIETIPNIVRWIKLDENKSLNLIGLRGLRLIKKD